MDYKAIRQDLMKPHKINALAICIVQIACIIGWEIWATISHLYPTEPYIFLTSSPILAAIVSFLLSLFLPIKSGFRKMLLLFVPAFLVYFYLYTRFYFMVDQYEIGGLIPFYCTYLFPFLLGVFFVNGSAVWLGSWIHHKLFKQKDGPSD
jgi:hypothetical protein